MSSVNAERILVVRNDKLGDFMLAWPALALLKRSLPEARVDVLVPDYTRELADACSWIDGVVIDPGPTAGGTELARRMRAGGYTALIALFSTGRVGLAGWRAGIPLRLAPATKLAQVFYNRRLRQRRSRSEKPEWEYNSDLVRCFLTERGVEARAAAPPFLCFDAERVAERERVFRARHGIETTRRLVFLHAGSGGSASNLSLEQFARLGGLLRSERGHALVLTAGPGELAQAEELAGLLEHTDAAIFDSSGGLRRFAEHLQFADLFISGSTGPLHLAGALDRPTAAFYPRRRSSTPLRWQTLNSPERRLAWASDPAAPESDLSSIDLAAAAEEINRRFLVG